MTYPSYLQKSIVQSISEDSRQLFAVYPPNNGAKISISLPLLNAHIKNILKSIKKSEDGVNSGTTTSIIICPTKDRCTELEKVVEALSAQCEGLVKVYSLIEKDQRDNLIKLHGISKEAASVKKLKKDWEGGVVISTP
jgi:hypothetical protein